jgi:hypothetical protein
MSFVKVARAAQHERMGVVTDQVRGELLHHVSSRRAGMNTIETEYRRQPFRVARPAAGQSPAAGEAVCQTCAETVPYRIMPADSTVRRRRIWLAVLLSGAAIGVAAIQLFFWPVEAIEGWPLLAFPAGIGLLFGGIAGRVNEDGVRLDRRRGRHRHIVRSGSRNTEGRARV